MFLYCTQAAPNTSRGISRQGSLYTDLATDWTSQSSNPSRGNIFFSPLKYPYRLSLCRILPAIHWVPGFFPRHKATGAWIWPPTSIQCRGQESVELHLYSPYMPSCSGQIEIYRFAITVWCDINPLMPELYPSAQRCPTRFFTGDFASWTVHFINICVKTQQMQQLFIQFINYVWYLLHV
jgi:hypothetical protein